jgi:hypothetical protein
LPVGEIGKAQPFTIIKPVALAVDEYFNIGAAVPVWVIHNNRFGVHNRGLGDALLPHLSWNLYWVRL